MNKYITFTETGGEYSLNAAEKGGIYYCDGCSMSVTQSVFSSIKGLYGGIIYSIGDTNIQVSLSNFTTSNAYYTGSLIEISTAETTSATSISISTSII